MYCKYTETKLILLFNVIPLDFNAPVPGFHKFFLIPSENSIFVSVFKQFLERIVTAYETRVLHYEAQSKAQNMAWKRPTSHVAKKFRSQQSAGKIMLTFFLEYGRCDFGHFTPRVEPLTVRTTVLCYERNWSPRSDPDAVENLGAKLVKDPTKILFFWRN
jgi:hypothetical protein